LFCCPQIKHNLRIITWNSNAVTTKKAELALFLNDNNIDIAAINETKLSTTSRFNIPGYITYRANRNHHGGGVMILIKHNIRHDQFIIHNLTGLEASAVYLYPQHTSKLLFVAAYQPPSSPLSTADLDQIFAQNDSVLIVGDLNSKHVS